MADECSPWGSTSVCGREDGVPDTGTPDAEGPGHAGPWEEGTDWVSLAHHPRDVLAIAELVMFVS